MYRILLGTINFHDLHQSSYMQNVALPALGFSATDQIVLRPRVSLSWLDIVRRNIHRMRLRFFPKKYNPAVTEVTYSKVEAGTDNRKVDPSMWFPSVGASTSLERMRLLENP